MVRRYDWASTRTLFTKTRASAVNPAKAKTVRSSTDTIFRIVRASCNLHEIALRIRKSFQENLGDFKYLLGNGSFLNSQNDTVFALYPNNSGSTTNRLHRIFCLQQMPIRTEHGNGTIIRHLLEFFRSLYACDIEESVVTLFEILLSFVVVVFPIISGFGPVCSPSIRWFSDGFGS